MPGPVPKPASQRRRRNAPAGPAPVTAPARGAVMPDPDLTWHPVALEWFRSLGESGQATLYERSDWATARYVAEAMSRSLVAGRFSGQLFAAIMAASTELLVTVGARRRLRVELERESTDEPVAVAIMASYRADAS